MGHARIPDALKDEWIAHATHHLDLLIVANGPIELPHLEAEVSQGAQHARIRRVDCPEGFLFAHQAFQDIHVLHLALLLLQRFGLILVPQHVSVASSSTGELFVAPFLQGAQRQQVLESLVQCRISWIYGQQVSKQLFGPGVIA